MTKGQLNIAAAELQEKVNRIDATREKAQQTAAAAVDRKYKKQLQELIDSKYVCSSDGESQDFVYSREVVNRVEFPDWWTRIVHSEMQVEDLAAEEAVDVTDEG